MTTWVLHRRHKRRQHRTVAAILIAGLAVAAPAMAGVSATDSSNAQAPRVTNGASAANAGDVDQRKEALIRTLVNLTDTPEVQAMFSSELVDRVSSAMSMFGPTLDPQTLDVVQQQTRAVVSEHIQDGDALYSVLAPVYEKHFNLIELNQLVQFYQSPLGQKLVDTSPELMSETMDLGSQWGLSLVPEIVQRVRAQLNGRTPTPTGNNDTAAGAAPSTP